MLRLRTGCALLVGVAVLAGGCSRGTAGGDGAGSKPEPKTVQRAEEVAVKVTIKVTGDYTADIVDEVVPMHLVSIETDDPQLTAQRIFGMEGVMPVRAGNSQFIAGWSVIPYRGPGTYTIEPGSIRDAAAAAQSGDPTSGGIVSSSIKVQWWPDANNVQQMWEYYRRVEPCTAVIETGGNSGHLTCPRITDENRAKHFSLDMKWAVTDAPA